MGKLGIRTFEWVYDGEDWKNMATNIVGERRKNSAFKMIILLVFTDSEGGK